MQAPPGLTTTAELLARLTNGSLAGEWRLDPGASSVRLKTRVMGLIPVNGVFRELSGAGQVSPDGQVSGTLTVSTASIDSRNTRRDEHLRSADFFDSGTHPAITFTADRIEPAGQVVAVYGTLTVRGQGRPLRFDAVPSVTGEGEIRLTAEVRVSRADFGLTWKAMGLTSMNNTMEIQASFNRG